MQIALIRKILLIAGVVCASMILSYLIDDNLEMGWPTNVERNWQEFGIFNLHWQLTYNPGGYQALENPQIYHGMSPVFLYPVYFAAKIFGWTGLGTLAFHILLLLVVLWASWNLMGRDDFAMLVPLIAVLCPGYLRWPKDFDPGALSVLPVLPYAVLVLAILKKTKFTPVLAAAILVLTLGLVSLNWTTAWICGPCIFFLLGTPGLNRRGLIFLIAIMFAGISAIALFSVAAKFGDMMHSGLGTSGKILTNYMWGNKSYGLGLTTGKAFLRLAFTNGIGLLPLWAVLVYAIVRRFRNGQRLAPLMFAPLVLAIADLGVMRDYFGHHPWMAGPVLLVGLIFSLALLRIPSDAECGPERIPCKFAASMALLCFAYGFAVLTFFRANETELLTLAQLVRHHTARSETLVLVKETDPQTAGMADRLDEQLDRHIIVVDDVKGLVSENDQGVVLSAVKLDDSFNLRAQSAVRPPSLLIKVTDWFNRTIARRTPGDRLVLSRTYFLYDIKTVNHAGVP